MSSVEPTVRFASRVARAGFTVAYNVVIFDRALSVQARLLYLQLSHYAYLCEQARRESPEQVEIAANLGIKERAMRPYIRELEQAGLVRVKARGRGMTHLYTVIEPSDGQLEDRQKTAGLDRQSTAPQSGSELPVSIEEKHGKTARANALAEADSHEERKNEIALALSAALATQLVGMTKAEKRRWFIAIEQLIAVNATADQIRERVAAYRKRWPEIACTPWALVSHWSSLAADVASTTEGALQKWIENAPANFTRETALELLDDRVLPGVDREAARAALIARFDRHDEDRRAA